MGVETEKNIINLENLMNTHCIPQYYRMKITLTKTKTFGYLTIFRANSLIAHVQDVWSPLWRMKAQ